MVIPSAELPAKAGSGPHRKDEGSAAPAPQVKDDVYIEDESDEPPRQRKRRSENDDHDDRRRRRHREDDDEDSTPKFGAGRVVSLILGSLLLLSGISGIGGLLFEKRDENVSVMMGRIAAIALILALAVALLMYGIKGSIQLGSTESRSRRRRRRRDRDDDDDD